MFMYFFYSFNHLNCFYRLIHIINWLDCSSWMLLFDVQKNFKRNLDKRMFSPLSLERIWPQLWCHSVPIVSLTGKLNIRFFWKNFYFNIYCVSYYFYNIWSYLHFIYIQDSFCFIIDLWKKRNFFPAGFLQSFIDFWDSSGVHLFFSFIVFCSRCLFTYILLTSDFNFLIFFSRKWSSFCPAQKSTNWSSFAKCLKPDLTFSIFFKY